MKFLLLCYSNTDSTSSISDFPTNKNLYLQSQIYKLSLPILSFLEAFDQPNMGLVFNEKCCWARCMWTVKWGGTRLPKMVNTSCQILDQLKLVEDLTALNEMISPLPYKIYKELENSITKFWTESMVKLVPLLVGIFNKLNVNITQVSDWESELVECNVIKHQLSSALSRERKKPEIILHKSYSTESKAKIIYNNNDKLKKEIQMIKTVSKYHGNASESVQLFATQRDLFSGDLFAVNNVMSLLYMLVDRHRLGRLTVRNV